MVSVIKKHTFTIFLLCALADTALFGSIFVLVCDTIAMVVIAPYELPIELIIGIVGSIVFIAMPLYRLNHGRKAVRLAVRTSAKGGGGK